MNGNVCPISSELTNINFPTLNNLTESRSLFIQKHHLAARFSKLSNYQTFNVAEIGFNTGINFFTTWDLWRQNRLNTAILSADDPLKDRSNAHLHFISFEKSPLTKESLQRMLAPLANDNSTLSPLIEQFVGIYPTLIEGCHRLNFHEDNLTLDLWLGDIGTNLSKLALIKPLSNNHRIDAWFLDNLSPSKDDPLKNKSLWTEQIFEQIDRLSQPYTTAAIFHANNANIEVQQSFSNIGFKITNIENIDNHHKIITAVKPDISSDSSTHNSSNRLNDSLNTNSKTALVIGAGVSGLMSAWALANRGVQVTLLDKTAPLAGASGNPRGLLAPKMTPIHHVAEHLHSIGYLYSSRLYRQISTLMSPTYHETWAGGDIIEPTGAVDLLLKTNINCEQISQYPEDFARVLTPQTAKISTGLQQDLTINQYLPQAGLINPYALAQHILAHPLISFKKAKVTGISEVNIQSEVAIQNFDNNTDCLHRKAIAHTEMGIKQADYLVVCTADKSCELDNNIFDFRKIRGQLSWFIPTNEQLKKLPKKPLKYGGYCTQFTPKVGDDLVNDVTVSKPSFLLGASFIRNDLDNTIRDEEHEISRIKLITAIPELATIITDTKGWQARVGIRSQTPDYNPLVGLVGKYQSILTLSGMGAKGYAYAPICSELLADLIMGRIPPLSADIVAKLSPNRKRLQTAL